jgi:hypothetical protein
MKLSFRAAGSYLVGSSAKLHEREPDHRALATDSVVTVSDPVATSCTPQEEHPITRDKLEVPCLVVARVVKP